MQVLLIEDDQQFIQLVERVAQSLELAFASCTHAGPGLERLRRGDVDILIVDGLLPDKSGWDILEELAGWPGRTPCTMFLSAFFRDMSSFKRLKKLGVAKILHKPISAHALRAELGALVASAQTMGDAGDAGQSPGRSAEDSATASLAAELQRMRRQYAENLAAVAAVEFAALIERVTRNDRAARGPLIDELESYCHRLSGTAGSYGQPHISEAAGDLERRVRTEPLPGLISDLHGLLAMLRGARGDPAAYRDAAQISPQLRLGLVVTELGALFSQVAGQLSSLGIAARHATSVGAAVSGLLRWWPDFIVVDSLAMAGDGVTPTVSVLARIPSGIPILVVGDCRDALPERIRHIPSIERGHEIRDILIVGAIQPFHGESLLLCDDDPATGDLVRSLFAPLGITVRSAGDIATYVDHLSETPPSVILLDIALPLVSGFDLCRMVKAEAATRDIPVIFVSARNGQADRRSAYQVGGDDYVAKPIAREELINAVSNALRRQRFTRLAIALAPVPG